jgi:phage shock protein E
MAVLRGYMLKRVILGLFIGVFFGATCMYINLQSQITYHKSVIDAVKLEVQDLNIKNKYYELELLDARNNITKCIDRKDELEFELQDVENDIEKYASYISYLESQILTILNNSRINYGDISVEQAKYIISSKPNLILIDVRTQEEYNNNHIEGSINIPLTVLDQKIMEFCSCEEFLVYCKSGSRSRQATDILLEKGYVRTYNMIGGIDAWNDSITYRGS